MLFDNFSNPIFRSRELGNYELLQEFEGSKAGSKLPSEIIKALGSEDKKGTQIGAY